MSDGRMVGLDLLGRFPDWYGDAACAEVGGDFWFPEPGDRGSEAKRICCRCLVREECGEWAVTQDHRFGIWGGVGEKERQRLKREAAGSEPVGGER